MIRTKEELAEYLKEESRNYLGNTNILRRILSALNSSPISDQIYIWKYIKTMRLCEYAQSHQKSIFGKIRKIYYSHLLLKYAYKTGFQIAPGTIGKGLAIWHWGMIIIHQDVRIGENCVLQPNVVIGKRKKQGMPPCIGNNAYICSGARILGDITIGDNVTIAPNTVVFKNVLSNCVVAGNPAIIIKKNGMKVHIPL